MVLIRHRIDVVSTPRHPEFYGGLPTSSNTFHGDRPYLSLLNHISEQPIQADGFQPHRGRFDQLSIVGRCLAHGYQRPRPKVLDGAPTAE